MEELIAYIETHLAKTSMRYEINKFDSGATMIDIWFLDKLYVVQHDKNIFGLSEVNDDTLLFDISPDKLFDSFEDFKFEFEKMLYGKDY